MKSPFDFYFKTCYASLSLIFIKGARGMNTLLNHKIVLTDKEIEKFWYRINIMNKGINECWHWISTMKRKHNTPQTFRKFKVQDIAYYLTNNNDNVDNKFYHVINTCGDVNCCNPFHLKEEIKPPVHMPIKNIGPVLNLLNVETILWVLKYRNNRTVVKDLARLYGCSVRAIYRIKNRTSWRHAVIPDKENIPSGIKPFWNQEMEDLYKNL